MALAHIPGRGVGRRGQCDDFSGGPGLQTGLQLFWTGTLLLRFRPHRGSISTTRAGRRRHPPSHRGWFPTTGATVNGRREKRPPVRSRLVLLTVPLPRLLGTAIAHLLPRLVTRCGRVEPVMGIRRAGASRKEQALNLKTDLIWTTALPPCKRR